MSSYICDDPLLKDEVVLMEDNPGTLEAIKKIFEDDFKWKVTIANNQQEVVNLAQEKSAAYFILDNEIGTNKQEGTFALTKIRKTDSMAFVTIFSSYPNAEAMVARLKGNLFELKEANLKENIQHIYSEMLKYRLQIIEKLQEEIPKMRADIVENLELIERLDKICDKDPNIVAYESPKLIERLDKICDKDPNIVAYESPKSDPEWVKQYQKQRGKDPNIVAYESLKSNSEWVKQCQGEYVAFVDGKFEFSHQNRQGFFEKLIESQEYRQREVFYMKVEDKERIIDILPSMESLLNESPK